MQWFREKGVHLIIYLDDILIMAQEERLARLHLSWTMQLLQDLSFIINVEKSQLQPVQNIEFLGFRIDSIATLLKLPLTKRLAIKKELRKALSAHSISLRVLARLVGLLASSIRAIFPGPLHYRALQRLKILHLQKGLTYSELIVLSHEARTELQWWLNHMDAWNGRAIFTSVPEVVIESDASRWGCGARCGQRETGGRWSLEELQLHINCLELLAGSFAVKTLSPSKSKCCILLKMDNIPAVRYISKLGETRSRMLVEIAEDFWHFCLARQISVSAEYIPGKVNKVADWNSRHLRDPSDWHLHPRIFQFLNHLWGPSKIDLFAFHLNTHIPLFFSWRPDPNALCSDAFLQDWKGDVHFAFPLFPMIPRVLLQVIWQKAELILITPFWKAQS
ncbi:hypothetical protein NDU88_004657 [Pleurodeles waltl]|uniref:ribonuclease H n=1 Tax=Pleurodeles waltl TaxID=8319 RepID=A0AAV7T9E8_PLEWA|nr:hypothetical protein NDU88_004657 [Pleurodeles waltl]